MTPVIRLSRALTVAHRQQQARSRPVAEQEEKPTRDRKTENALQEIGGNRGHARVEDGRVALLVLLAFVGAQRHRDEPEAEAVVGQRLHGHLVKERAARDFLYRDVGKKD